MSDPDVVDNRSSFALGSLGVSDQVVPGTENPPTEGEVLIRGTGQAETRVFGHPARTVSINKKLNSILCYADDAKLYLSMKLD